MVFGRQVAFARKKVHLAPANKGLSMRSVQLASVWAPQSMRVDPKPIFQGHLNLIGAF
jgi:hypothetical protein